MSKNPRKSLFVPWIEAEVQNAVSNSVQNGKSEHLNRPRKRICVVNESPNQRWNSEQCDHRMDCLMSTSQALESGCGLRRHSNQSNRTIQLYLKSPSVVGTPIGCDLPTAQCPLSNHFHIRFRQTNRCVAISSTCFSWFRGKKVDRSMAFRRHFRIHSSGVFVHAIKQNTFSLFFLKPEGLLMPPLKSDLKRSINYLDEYWRCVPYRFIQVENGNYFVFLCFLLFSSMNISIVKLGSINRFYSTALPWKYNTGNFMSGFSIKFFIFMKDTRVCKRKSAACIFG